MSTSPETVLSDLQPSRDYFIGIDSDGCVFDTMEIKHKECFCPNFIKHFKLQTVSKYARETWEYVNLYSKTRGLNRFLALIEADKLLKERPEVQTRGAEMPDMSSLIEWTRNETKLSNRILKKYALAAGDSGIDRAYIWSLEVNETISEMVRGMKPFPLVQESMEKMSALADVLVVSQSPVKSLQREWKGSEIESYVMGMAGQEHGTKTEHIALAAVGKYPSDKIVIIGDAPGDQKAAQENGVLFYPINPGDEESSWRRFIAEGFERFSNGTFTGDYQNQLVLEFEACLSNKPPWK